MSVRGWSGQLEVTLRLSGPLCVILFMNLCVKKNHFVSQTSQPPQIVQKWFCIQNVRMDLSFKEKKTVCNFVVWFLKYQAKRKVVIFFGTPCRNKV